jgi:hypothetical protein
MKMSQIIFLISSKNLRHQEKRRISKKKKRNSKKYFVTVSKNPAVTPSRKYKIQYLNASTT